MARASRALHHLEWISRPRLILAPPASLYFFRDEPPTHLRVTWSNGLAMTRAQHLESRRGTPRRFLMMTLLSTTPLLLHQDGSSCLLLDSLGIDIRVEVSITIRRKEVGCGCRLVEILAKGHCEAL
jgi:hypothetical protein